MSRVSTYYITNYSSTHKRIIYDTCIPVCHDNAVRRSHHTSAAWLFAMVYVRIGQTWSPSLHLSSPPTHLSYSLVFEGYLLTRSCLAVSEEERCKPLGKKVITRVLGLTYCMHCVWTHTPTVSWVWEGQFRFHSLAQLLCTKYDNLHLAGGHNWRLEVF